MAFLNSIRGRLILLVLLLVVPAAALLHSAALHNRDLQLAQARQRLLIVAQQASRELQQVVRDTRNLHYSLSLVPAVRNLTEPECSRVLAEALARSPIHATIIATDRQGRERCNASPKKGARGARREYGGDAHFRRMLESDGPVIGVPGSELWSDSSSHNAALPLFGPLRDERGELVGALIVPLDLASFSDEFVNAHLIPGLVFHLWDRDGRILFRYPDVEQLTGRQFSDLPLVRLAVEKGGSGVVDTKGFDGIARVAGYSAPAGEYKNTGIHIGVTEPAAAFYEGPDAVMARVFGSMLTIALLGVLAAWLFGSRLIWRQIEVIAGAAQRLAAGQSSARVGMPYPTGELGQLARTFDGMAEASERHLKEVESLNATLEARVAERTARLEASEARFRGVLESAADAFVIVDGEGRIVIVNASAEALFGYERAELLGLPVDALLPERLRDAHRQQRTGYGEAPATKAMSMRGGLKGRRKDGSEFSVSVSLSPLRTDDGLLVTAVVRDITQAEDAAAELQRVNRTLRMLSVCNEALVRADDEYSLLAAICRTVVEVGSYRLAWVGFALHDEAKSVLPAAHFGEEGYVEQLHITWADRERGRGPVGTAIREERPVVVHDLDRDPNFLPWQSAAGEHGFVSVIALPLFGRKGVFGTLAIYSAERGVFDAAEVKLLVELADDLAYGISSLRESAARARVEHELDFRVSFDTLTGLPNRAVFVDRIEQALVHAARNGRQVAVLQLDLDRFKNVNDSVGRAAGDHVLREIAQRVLAVLCEGDTVARLSVDEFGVLLGDMARMEDALPLAQKLLHAVAQAVRWEGESTLDIFVTGSIGIGVFPRDGDSAERLLRSADAAMHAAKALGGNVFQFFAEETNRKVSSRIVLDGALRRALERDELQVHYQPKVSLISGAVIGAEALVRWPHPDMGMIAPTEFIPLAEETGLIVPIGEWVLHTACRQMQAWEAAGLPLPGIAVNLSARQFMQHNLTETIRRVLDAYRMEARNLDVEITETTAMLDVDRAVGILRELKALGVRLSLDDFGTGYSSLGYLKRFPLDCLKIDRAFVRDITSDPDDALICAAVIGLAHNLKMNVIAEGVETEGQMNYLRQHRCDEMQGYFFSRPLPADEFSTLLTSGRTLSFSGGGGTQRTLLLVDDEENVLSALKRLLRRGGYRILTAGSAAEGFELLAVNEVQVIISDQRMPAMSGTAFLRRVKDLYPDTVRIVLSGYTELSSVTEAINQGAIYKFLTKPWDEDDLLDKVKEAFRHYEAQKSKQPAGKG